MAKNGTPAESRRARREKLNKIQEQIVAMDECGEIQESEDEDCCLAEELNKIKERIRKRSDEAVLATCTK